MRASTVAKEILCEACELHGKHMFQVVIFDPTDG